MIKNAKVSLSAVKPFEQVVAMVRDYSDKFDRGITCFDDFQCFLGDRATSLRETIDKIQCAQDRLATKIKGFEAESARLTEILNDLEDQLSSLEDKLAGTPESFTVTDNGGEEHEVINPVYAAIEAKIASVESRINAAEAELFSVQQKLDHAYSVDRQMTFHADSINGVIYSIEEKQNTCRQLKEELEEIKNSNFHRGISADESLKKIIEIVTDYLKIRMVYDNATAPNPNTTTSPGGININLNINKNIVQGPKADVPPEINKGTVSSENIVKYGIEFGSGGRVSLYDGKSFGGKYNSYEARCDCIKMAGNLIWGYFEGNKGESKYVPAGRTVKGIVVIDILKKYGVDGIVYRNAEPDFEVCSEAVVKIKAMSKNRENYRDSYGISKLGNFSQADIACAKLWNSQGRGGRTDWEARDVLDYRKLNGLTWHEKCDTETMVLVRSEINDYFKHSGGCSECAKRDAEQNGGGFDE